LEVAAMIVVFDCGFIRANFYEAEGAYLLYSRLAGLPEHYRQRIPRLTHHDSHKNGMQA
jgi:hypothetical protein